MEGVNIWIKIPLFCIIIFVYHGQSQEIPPMKIPYATLPKVKPFDLRDVKLLDSFFEHAMEKNPEYLLMLKQDRCWKVINQENILFRYIMSLNLLRKEKKK